jgi:glycosyltransferase involved in cell wall biosynthesis
MKANRIIFFTKYTEAGPSSRYRIYQYRDCYEKAGFTCIMKPLFNDRYIRHLYSNEPLSFLNIPGAYFKRLASLFNMRKGDLAYIEYELFPYLPPAAEWFLKRIKKVKYILDYDDAIFHNYDQHKNAIIRFFLKEKIPRIVREAETLITGSPYLTAKLAAFNNNCFEIPTSIDITRYRRNKDLPSSAPDQRFNIGWIGSRTTSANLLLVLPSLRDIAEKAEYKLSLIGFDKSLIKNLEGINYELIKWDKQSEVDEIRKFDVGIMPLADNKFNRGKCGFKLIQYMACGIITISTPLEANVKINRNKRNLHATVREDWTRELLKVCNRREEYRKLGKENIPVVEMYYSKQANCGKYVEILNSIFRNENNPGL